MSELSRRKFLQYCGTLTAILGLESTVLPSICEALSQIINGRAPILWLQGQSCSGCSVSLLNAVDPGPAQILTHYVSLCFHSTLSAATGHTCLEIINTMIEKGGYLLILEGSIPTRLPQACMVGDEPLTKQIIRAAKPAKAIIALGTCASFGGIPASEGNLTGAQGAMDYLSSVGISTPLINIPGCPAHPDWLVGTLVYLLKFGTPAVDEWKRPTMFFGKTLHDQCPRFADYERERFARSFNEDGCLFRLGCLGPNTHTDCSLRLWNSKINSCIHAGAPCIGCTMPTFSRNASLPFYRKRELLNPPVKED